VEPFEKFSSQTKKLDGISGIMPVMENELCRNFASRGFGPAEMGALGRGLLADGFFGSFREAWLRTVFLTTMDEV